MPRPAELPTSIRLSRDLKAKLRHMAEKENRSVSVQIVHILKVATEFVRVPRLRRASPKKENGEG